MAININDLKIFQSQDNSDNDSGGGSKTSTEIVDGNVNNLYPDISRIDTVSGDVGLRKIFPTVYTLNRDVYYGAHMIIRKKPSDPKVSALLFHSDDPYDKRVDVQNKIESYVVASYKEQFYLFGNHVAGSKAVTFLQTLDSSPPSIGEVYLLIDNSSGMEQYIRISDMQVATINLSYNNNGNIETYERRRIICEIEQSLIANFPGSSFDPVGQEAGTTDTFATQVADAAKYYSTRPVSINASAGDQSITVDSIFEPLVPSSKAHSPLVNQQALVNGEALVKSGRVISNYVEFTNVPGVIRIGYAITPGTLSFSAHSDDGKGNIVNINTGVNVATIDYSSGKIDNSSGGISLVGKLIVTSELAGGSDSPLQFTGSILVTSSNQGLVYVRNLSPIPSPGLLYIDYRSNGKWYRVNLNYDNTIGADASIGAGSLNDNGDGTGTVSLTLGALPDIDSTIIYTWGSVGRFNDRFNDTDIDIVLKIDLPGGTIDPTSFSADVPNDAGVVGTLTCDSAGVISDSLGAINGVVNLDNNTLIITSSGGTASRFPPPGSNHNVSISYDHSDPAPGNDGEWKQVIISEVAGDFVTLNRDTNDYTFNIGESVLKHTVKMSLDVEFVTSSFLLASPLTGGYNQKINLVVTSTGQLVEEYGNSNHVWGSVATNGDVVLILPSKNMKIPSLNLGNNFTTTPRYSVSARQSLLSKNSIINIVYRNTDPVNFPSAGSVSGTFESISNYLIKCPGQINGEVAFRMCHDSDTDLLVNLYSDGDAIFDRVSSINPAQVGVIDKLKGLIEVNYISQPRDFYIGFSSLFTDEIAPEDSQSKIFDFRTSATKIVPSSFQLRYKISANQNLQSATTDQNGVITGDGIDSNLSYVDTDTGSIHLEFTNNTFPDTFMYDTVAETVIPIDPELLGLNPIRLPPDGRVPIYEPGRHLVIFNEVTTSVSGGTPSPDQVINLARSGQSYIEVIDVNGKRLNTTQYTADKTTGTVVFGNPLVLEDKYGNALTAPYSVVDRVEDMLLATDVQINGLIALSAQLNHDYPASGSFVASALVWGDTGARVYNLFSQEVWSSGAPVWQDTLLGDPTTAQYDDINYPIQIDNKSSASGRWAIIFKSSTTVDVAHEKLGIVATGVSISSVDVAPINPATGAPYFVMLKNGFGNGWVTNNVIRFNTDSGDNNAWLIRTVQSGALTENVDGIEIEQRGDAN